MTVTDPPPPPTILLSDKLMAITNLNNIIPVKLDMDEMNYSSWVYFFTHFCRGNLLLDHIETKNASDASSSTLPPHDAEWLKVDSILLSWIFVTVSKTLQQRLVVENPKMAKDAWDTLATIFSDNKRTRSIALKAELRSLKLGDMGIDAYFRKIESIATVLNSLGSTLDNDDVVTFALEGLPARYDNVATIIAHRDPFPDLKTVRSMLTTEEMRQKARTQDTLSDPTPSSPMVLLANTGSTTRRPFNSTEKVHKPCNNYLKGYCRFGASCRFLHNGVHGHSPRAPSSSSNIITPNDMQSLQSLLAKLGCHATGPTPQLSTTVNGSTTAPGLSMQPVIHPTVNPPVAYHTSPLGFGSPQPPTVGPSTIQSATFHLTGHQQLLYPGQPQVQYPVQQMGHYPGQLPMAVHYPVHQQVQPNPPLGQPLGPGILGPAPSAPVQPTTSGLLGASMGQEIVLPHAFAAPILHDPVPGNWNMDTGFSNSSGAAPL